LSVNLNRVALLRNSRRVALPSLEHAARIVIAAGTDGITVHPRPDERHITRDDVALLRKVIDSAERRVEFNIEGYPDEPLLRLVEAMQPDQCTLVPDAPDQLTSDHGWDVVRQADVLVPALKRLQGAGIRVSAFLDPDPEQVTAAAKLGVDRIELYTEHYAKSWGTPALSQAFAQHETAAAAALSAGIGVNAGHDLNLKNLPHFSQLPGLLECSIGHALISDAVFIGLAESVGRYRQAINGECPECDWYPQESG
jgi:pyridoxine 5-phosphate synthase